MTGRIAGTVALAALLSAWLLAPPAPARTADLRLRGAPSVAAGTPRGLELAVSGERRGVRVRLTVTRLVERDGAPLARTVRLPGVRLGALRAGRRLGRGRLTLAAGLHRVRAAFVADGAQQPFATRELLAVGSSSIAAPAILLGEDRDARDPGVRRLRDLGGLRGALGARPRGAAAQTGERVPEFDVGAPSGRYAGRPPKGIVVLVHGGGWAGGGPPDRSSYDRALGDLWLSTVAPSMDRWRARGWATVSVDYYSGATSLRTVERFTREVREARPDLPLCLYGESAGGHLALMTAARLGRAVRCVVNAAGPTDLEAFGRVPATPAPGCRTTAGPVSVRCLAEHWFGAGRLRTWSPLHRSLPARVLVAHAQTDPVVPPSQGSTLRRDGRAAVVRQLVLRPPGKTTPYVFVHGPTSRDEIRRFLDAERSVAG